MSNQRDNSGILGKNQRKTKDTHPGYTGQATIAGRAYWISAWIKDGKDGSKFFSLAFKPKDAPPAAQPPSSPSATQPPPPAPEPDDIPF